ncbi:hypothetical protein DEDE109153_15005 [Deinococcus deserti]
MTTGYIGTLMVSLPSCMSVIYLSFLSLSVTINWSKVIRSYNRSGWVAELTGYS